MEELYEKLCYLPPGLTQTWLRPGILLSLLPSQGTMLITSALTVPD